MSNRGSEWHRWEPHIHAPGTLFNNQFKGPNAWGDYLTSLEQATPVIRAIAVTDYYCTDTYQHVVRDMKENGRLPEVALVFPNVELRLDVATVKERWTNIHLLVCPNDPKHVSEVERFLSRLRFEAFGDNFACTREDLAKLGRKSRPELTDERAAFRHGASQFKVNFGKLREEYGRSDWAKENILIAVAGAETDGTSGIRDANDATLRQEIEKFAHVIFASSPAQRDFWLGRRSGVGEDVLRERYDGCKPCLHGSDAHEQATVAKPDGDRYSWIKGALEFNALRQAYIDPAGRAYVGPHPPFRATPARVIAEVELTGADWAQTPKLALNPGLVAIIGARGSGKTALADAIAAGCDATDGRLSNASFIVRAREHLDGVGVLLNWETGDPSVRPLLDDSFDPSLYPRARYLSQKFVEELCSADGLRDELLSEIARVIFEAHSTLGRDGATDFAELLQLRTTVLRDNRDRDEEAIETLSDQIGLEREKQSQIAGLKSQIGQKEALIAGYIKSRDKLVTAGSAERVARLNALTEAADHVRTQIRLWSQESQALRSLQNDVSDFRINRAPMALRTTKQNFVGAHLDDKTWEVFRQTYAGNVDGTLTERLAKAERETAAWRGKELPRKANDQEPYVADDAELKQLSLGELEAEIGRIQRLINIDTDTANRLRTITTKIGDENAALKRLKDSLADCEGAAARTSQLQSEREKAYLRVFESIVAEEQVLHTLYRPLMDRLAQAPGTLRKLSFSVSRHADVHRWASEGEGLFDKRRSGPFKGVGTLEAWANALLKPAWESGHPTAVAEAMAGFRQAHQAELLDLSEVPRLQQADYRSWLRRFAKWLYGTSHIEVSYSIDYEAVDIRKLSPGTRGIVLLLLYLALDDSDDRPLIIDQPEENLDPKSIFDELVELFIAAKNVRQVIMVTHNANLVVNTDADQVIVAFSGTHTPGKLPPIRYLSGGLENAEMRKHVCDILEGGDRAFKERATTACPPRSMRAFDEMESELDPDRIGRIGERHFEVLCERAGLYCNKSAVDVMGWDFIVEFPIAAAGQATPLDQRPTNAARVQLKSTLGRAGNRIRLSLSAIDRLAKDPRPALIVVFRLRADGELQSGYLVHLIGSELARVLRRLRAAEARKAHDINHTDISYDYEKVGIRFEPTPTGLLAALSSACGEDPGAYTIEKQRQLAELGYENGQFEAEALIQIEGSEHFSNLLLGLAPLKPHRLQVFDSRFGIRLPYQGTLFDDLEELRLTPPTLGSCEISVRGSGFGQAARFDGEMFIGPPMTEPQGAQLLVRTSDFIIRLTPPALKFESVGSIDDMEHTMEEWAELLRALTLMATGRATLTIAGNDRIPAITFPVDQPVTGPYLEEIPLISEFVDGWLRLLANAGLRSTARFKLDAFWKSNEAHMAVDLLLNPKSLARFEFQNLEIGDSSSLPEGLYFNSTSFADTSITFSAKVFFEKTEDPEWGYRSTGFEALDVRPKVDDLEEYGMDQAAACDLKLLIDPRNITLTPQGDTPEASSTSQE